MARSGRRRSCADEAIPVADPIEARVLFAADAAGLAGAGADQWLVAETHETPTVSAPADALVVVDADLQDLDRILDALQAQQDAGASIDWMVLDDDTDGIVAVGDALADRGGRYASLQFITHGAAGRFELGSTVIDGATIAQRGAQISTWADHLTEDADLLVYGCDVAASPEGLALVAELARLTQADVAASDDISGNAQLGGNWRLETQTGVIEAAGALTIEAGESLTGLLDVSFSGPGTRVNDGPAGTQSFGTDSRNNPGNDASMTHSGARNLASNDDTTVVVWISDDRPQFQVFDTGSAPAGAAVGTNRTIATATGSIASQATVAINQHGDFMVAWHSIAANGDDQGILAQLFNEDGEVQDKPTNTPWALTDPGAPVDTFRLTPPATGPHALTGQQILPSIGLFDNGSFIVTWTRISDAPGNDREVYYNTFSPNGNPRTALAERAIMASPNAHQQRSVVAIDPASRDAVIAFEDTSSGVSRIKLLTVDSNGARLGAVREVPDAGNGSTTRQQTMPSIAIDPEKDRTVVAWEVNQSSGTQWIEFTVFRGYSSSDMVAVIPLLSWNGTAPLAPWGDRLNPSASINRYGDVIVAWEADQTFVTQDSDIIVRHMPPGPDGSYLPASGAQGIQYVPGSGSGRSGDQYFPQVLVRDDSVWVAWSGEGSVTGVEDPTGIYMTIGPLDRTGQNTNAEPPDAPPASSGGSITVREQTTHAFDLTDFNFSDAEDGPTALATAIRIESLPTTGDLQLDNEPVSEGERITAANITADRFTFSATSPVSADTQDAFHFTVLDATGNTALNAASLSINIRNNQPPDITLNPGDANEGQMTLSVDENTTTALTFSASDPDDDPVTASLGNLATGTGFGSGEDSDLFAIESDGRIVFKTRPDFENPLDQDGDNRYELTLLASDDADTSRQSVTVVVENVNEAPGFTTPATGGSAPGVFTRQVDENTSGAVAIGAIDPEGGLVSYSIDPASPDFSHFYLDGSVNPPLLRFVTPPDFERSADANDDNTYEVTVQASDPELLISRLTFEMTVVNTLEPLLAAPIPRQTTNYNLAFELPSLQIFDGASIPAIGIHFVPTSAIGQLSTTGQQPIAIINGTREGRDRAFVFTPTADRDGTAEVTITLRDPNNAERNRSMTIQIVVLPLNAPLAPVTDLNLATNTIAEDAEPGSGAGITASASVSNAAGIITYSLSDSSSGRFKVDPDTGVVTRTDTGTLDFENEPVVTVGIEATSPNRAPSRLLLDISIANVPEALSLSTPDTPQNGMAGAPVALAPIQFADPDDAATLMFSITAPVGRVVVNDLDGSLAMLTGTDETGHRVTLSGPADALRLALASLRYEPDASTVGLVTLEARLTAPDLPTVRDPVTRRFDILLAAPPVEAPAPREPVSTSPPPPSATPAIPSSSSTTSNAQQSADSRSPSLADTAEAGSNTGDSSDAGAVTPIANPPASQPASTGNTPGAGNAAIANSVIQAGENNSAHSDVSERWRVSGRQDLSEIRYTPPGQASGDSVPMTIDFDASLSPAPTAILNARQSYQSADFLRSMQDVRNDMFEGVQLEQRFVASSVALSTGLSIGYVIWLVRGGALLSSVLASMPAWRSIDPLPVLGTLGRNDDPRSRDDGESLESMLEKAREQAPSNAPQASDPPDKAS